MIRQSEVAKSVGISEPYLSQILSGKYEPSKETAKKFGKFTKVPWTDFLTMKPRQIRRLLFAAAEARANG